MPNGFRCPKFVPIATTICLLVALLLAACTQLEKTVETHTTHVIDYGVELTDGVKLTDPDAVSFVLYRDGAVAGVGEQTFNGMMVLPPSRYWTLLTNEAALAELAGEAVDGKFAATLETTAAAVAAELRIPLPEARDVAFGRMVRARLADAVKRIRPP